MGLESSRPYASVTKSEGMIETVGVFKVRREEKLLPK